MKLVMVHGSGGYGGVWKYQLAAFPDAEAVTLPGHPEGKLCTSVEEYTDWLHGYIKGKGYRDPVLMGHSLGGAIVMMYALKYPQDVKALILVGTGARLRVHPMYTQELEEAIRGNREPWLKRMEERYQKVAPAFKEELIRKHLEIGPQAQLNDLLCCDKFDIMDRVQEINLPTLVICGDEDIMTPVKYADYLANKIKGAKEVIIPGATHHVFMEKPEEFNRAVADFLAGL